MKLILLDNTVLECYAFLFVITLLQVPPSQDKEMMLQIIKLEIKLNAHFLKCLSEWVMTIKSSEINNVNKEFSHSVLRKRKWLQYMLMKKVQPMFSLKVLQTFYLNIVLNLLIKMVQSAKLIQILLTQSNKLLKPLQLNHWELFY